MYLLKKLSKLCNRTNNVYAIATCSNLGIVLSLWLRMAYVSFNRIGSLSKAFLNNNAFKAGINQVRQKSCKPKLAVSDDKSMILCWHPETTFPYECTKPIPAQPKNLKEDLHLKVQYYEEEENKYKLERGPDRKELMKMFHTTRHQFDRKPFKRYEEKFPKPRESL